MNVTLNAKDLEEMKRISNGELGFNLLDCDKVCENCKSAAIFEFYIITEYSITLKTVISMHALLY